MPKLNIKIWITYESEGNKHVDTYTLAEVPKGYKTLGEYLVDLLWDGLDNLDDKYFWNITTVKVTLRSEQTKMAFETKGADALERMDELLARVFSRNLNEIERGETAMEVEKWLKRAK